MQPEALRTLLTINVVAYLAWGLLLRHFGLTNYFVQEHLALHPVMPGILIEPWQVITYNFLHLGGGLGGFLHILFNMLWLYWLGRGYEDMHGSHKLLAVYVLGGIGGGVLSVVVYSFGAAPAFIHGASASVIGVITAVATHYPNRGIGLLFIGVIPLKYLVIGFLALDLLFGIGSNVAVSAHFGGALSGFLFARAERRGINVAGWARLFFPKRRAQGRSVLGRLGGIFSSSGSGSPSGRQKARSSREQKKSSRIDESEVDRILDKISEKGYDALTEEERRILYEASKR